MVQTLRVSEVTQDQINRAVDFAFETVGSGIPWHGRLPKFDENEIKEIQRSILWFKANELRLQRGGRIEPIALSVFDSQRRGKLVKMGDGFAPIPTKNSEIAISSLIEGGKPQFSTPDVMKNIEVVNTLAGTTLSLM